MAEKKIKAKELINDIRAGMDNENLMHNYGLSAEGIIQAMNRLIWEALIAPSALSDQKSVARTVYVPIFKCLLSGDIQLRTSDKRPHLGSFLKNLTEKKSSFQ